jgi:hypothetical protein
MCVCVRLSREGGPRRARKRPAAAPASGFDAGSASAAKRPAAAPASGFAAGSASAAGSGSPSEEVPCTPPPKGKQQEDPHPDSTAAAAFLSQMGMFQDPHPACNCRVPFCSWKHL